MLTEVGALSFSRLLQYYLLVSHDLWISHKMISLVYLLRPTAFVMFFKDKIILSGHTGNAIENIPSFEKL